MMSRIDVILVLLYFLVVILFVIKVVFKYLFDDLMECKIFFGEVVLVVGIK